MREDDGELKLRDGDGDEDVEESEGEVVRNAYKITDEMVSDIMCAALDPGYGGSAYWADFLKLRAPAEIKLRDFEDSDGKTYVGEYLVNGGWYAIGEYDDARNGEWHPLTAAMLKTGIRKAALHFKQSPAAFYEDHDASTADCALQLAIFPEIVYG